MFTGLAGIVLSVWHSIFCGNSILWRWWERDGSKRLNHCVRSCCWLLVTLEQATEEKGELVNKSLSYSDFQGSTQDSWHALSLSLTQEETAGIIR